MNSGIVPSEPECCKNQVDDGGCGGADPCGAPPEDCETGCDQPDAGAVSQQVLAGKIFAQGLDGLMRAIEGAPGDIENAGESRAQGIEPNTNFHLSISPAFVSRKTGTEGRYVRFSTSGLIVGQQWYIGQSHFRKSDWTIQDAESR